MNVLKVLLPEVKRDDDGIFLGFDYTKKLTIEDFQLVSPNEIDSGWFTKNDSIDYTFPNNIQRDCLLKYVEGIFNNFKNLKSSGFGKWTSYFDENDAETQTAPYNVVCKSQESGALKNASTSYTLRTTASARPSDGMTLTQLTIYISKMLLSDYIRYDVRITEEAIGCTDGVDSDPVNVNLEGQLQRLSIEVDTRDNGTLNIVYDGNGSITSRAYMQNDYETID